jgi:acyl-ACP thioesterase
VTAPDRGFVPDPPAGRVFAAPRTVRTTDITPAGRLRTTTIAAEGNDLIQARAIWVAVSGADGGPVPLSAGFRAVYAESAQGRRATARLFLPPPAANLRSRPWQLRACDLDTAGHVNNTVHWAAIEDVLADAGWVPASAELEYRQPVLPGTEPRLTASLTPGRAEAWLTAGTELLAAARLTAR